MTESAALIERLRRIAAVGARVRDAGDDEAWLGKGLAGGQLHEVYAAEAREAASAAGFGVALALAAGAAPLFWLRTREAERHAGRLHATGLVELGLDASALLLGVVDDAPALLRAAADAARCAGLGALLLESWGRAPGLDLTATRRLQLAAEGSGVTVLSLRIGAEPVPSAAATRWRVAAAPSAALAAEAPGAPAFDVELLRRRGGPAGRRWHVEWNRDEHCFAPLSGAGLSLAVDRAAARHAPAPVRRAG